MKSASHLVIFNTAAVLVLPYRWQPTTTYQEEEEKLITSLCSSSLIDGCENICDFRSELKFYENIKI